MHYSRKPRTRGLADPRETVVEKGFKLGQGGATETGNWEYLFTRERHMETAARNLESMKQKRGERGKKAEALTQGVTTPEGAAAKTAEDTESRNLQQVAHAKTSLQAIAKKGEAQAKSETTSQ